ncbi:MAG: type II secretion system protein [Bacilli bacterium]|nr:type II secretion system protein [Bacilli bacterium]
MKKLNKKGFTLVELLAVIVVLALIMVLAVPSVLTSMNSARQSTFLLYASKMIEAAQTRYQSELLLGTPSTCYSIKDLNDSSSNQYIGKIVISNAASTNPIYKIQMYDNSYQIGIQAEPDSVTNKVGDKAGGVTYADIEAIKKNLTKDKALQSGSGAKIIGCDGKTELK